MEYKVKAGSEEMYHLKIEDVLFDQYTGERLSQPKIVKLHPINFERIQDSGALSGKTVEILHNPTKQTKGIESIKEQTSVDVEDKLGAVKPPIKRKSTTSK